MSAQDARAQPLELWRTGFERHRRGELRAAVELYWSRVCWLVEIAKRIFHFHDSHPQLRMSLAQRTRVRKKCNKHPPQEARTVQQLMREVATPPATVVSAEPTDASVPTTSFRLCGLAQEWAREQAPRS